MKYTDCQHSIAVKYFTKVEKVPFEVNFGLSV